MRLRLRLFVTSLLVAVPVAVGFMYLSQRDRLRDMEDRLRQSMQSELASGFVERCANDRGPGDFRLPPPPPPPGRRGGPPPPGPDGPRARVFGYSASYEPADPHAPPLPDALRTALAASDSGATTFDGRDGQGVVVAMRTGAADGPCVFAAGRMEPRVGVVRDEWVTLALVIVSVLGTAWIAAGPVIGRMRRLADAVHRSAESHYASPVTMGGSARDEIADLAKAFDAAGARVRQHLTDVEAKRESLQRFVANTTHDVAMPLTVLQGHLVELEQRAAPGSPEQSHAREAIREAHYMSSLLRNLGAAARLDAISDVEAAEWHPVDLRALVERVSARHQAIARAKDVELNFAVPETPVSALGDVTLLEQAVSNLVENAVQYNRSGGHVAVVLDRRGTDRFAITVSDDGPGVPEPELASLTTRRFRGSEARTRRPDGQGLGLSIVAEAAERLGLTLVFRRSPDGGLTAEMQGSQSPSNTGGFLATNAR